MVRFGISGKEKYQLLCGEEKISAPLWRRENICSSVEKRNIYSSVKKRKYLLLSEFEPKLPGRPSRNLITVIYLGNGDGRFL